MKHPVNSFFNLIKFVIGFSILQMGAVPSWAQETKDFVIKGKVISSKDGQPLEKASVRIKDTDFLSFTDADGRFTFRTSLQKGTLHFSFVGYHDEMIPFNGDQSEYLVRLNPSDYTLQEVEISTGYQYIPEERATGSFVHIDQELLNRSIGSNVLDRLRGITRSMTFNDIGVGASSLYNQPALSIRGRSTMSSNAEPLIVLDNFPYFGDINAINPEDIESVTILQDGAATSIWGAQAGNGVIVLTSKKGKQGQPIQLSANSHVSISEKPNLFYAPVLPFEDYIEIERFLFEKGAYNSRINRKYMYVTPAVELLAAGREGTISKQEMEDGLARLAKQDLRRDLLNHAYGRQALQNAAVNVSGGSEANSYYLSLGYDRNTGQIRYNGNDRLSLQARNNYRLFEDRLALEGAVWFTKTTAKAGIESTLSGIALYDRLVDEQGLPTAVGTSVYNRTYLDTAGAGFLLDWGYRPLDELSNGHRRGISTTNQFQLSADARPVDWLNTKVTYQYGIGAVANSFESAPESFMVRDAINRFSQVDPISGAVSSPVPMGARMDETKHEYTSHNLRFQIEAHQNWGGIHNVSAIAGAEWMMHETRYQTRETWYGYHRATETYIPVDFFIRYPQYFSSGTANIPGIGNGARERTDNHTRSFFANGSYRLMDRYVGTLSIRKDEANIFGVDANMKGRPFWSAGLLWHIHNEPFFGVDWISKLSIRATNGYSGNVNPSVPAYVTAMAGSNPHIMSGYPFQTIVRPPNPSLTWEKVRMTNLAIDFTIAQRITGSLEWYKRRVTDLLSIAPYRPSSGFNSFAGNFSAMEGQGFDFSLNTRNLTGRFSWVTDMFLSHTADKITKDEHKPSNLGSYFTGLGTFAVVGKPFHSIFSYPFAGLSNQGLAQGWLKGEISTAYSQILNETTIGELQYHGPASPTYFGALRNTFAYANFSLSFNVMFKAGYFFRRQGVSYSTLYSVSSPSAMINAIFNADYVKRWQAPGDERVTQVPAASYPANSQADLFYARSSALVEKGDHVRLQDVRLRYRTAALARYGIRSAEISFYVNNVGLVWAANKHGIDPDMVPTTGLAYPAVRSYAFGLNVNF